MSLSTVRRALLLATIILIAPSPALEHHKAVPNQTLPLPPCKIILLHHYGAAITPAGHTNSFALSIFNSAVYRKAFTRWSAGQPVFCRLHNALSRVINKSRHCLILFSKQPTVPTHQQLPQPYPPPSIAAISVTNQIA